MATATFTSESKHLVELELRLQAFKLASPIIRALDECDPELRKVALELFEQLGGGELDAEQAKSTTALIAEILFPNGDHAGAPGLDLVEAEKLAATADPAVGPLLDEMDRQEATFAERLRALMTEKGLTQAELAAKVGIGQPAISMMLNRNCRPQRKTVQRIAAALGVDSSQLWTGLPIPRARHPRDRSDELSLSVRRAEADRLSG